MESVALFFHLLGALSFVSGAIVAGVAFESARRRVEPREIALLLGLSRIGVVLVLAGTLLVLGSGLWLVHLGHWGYGTLWVDAALALLFVSAALGAAGGRTPKQARRLAEQCARDGLPTGDELRRLLDDPRSRLANYASAVLVLAIVALMVWKPA
jgi:uncharacterized membrane protein